MSDYGIWDLLCECWVVPPGLSEQAALDLLPEAAKHSGGEPVVLSLREMRGETP